jgi:hypothetical protein
MAGGIPLDWLVICQSQRNQILQVGFVRKYGEKHGKKHGIDGLKLSFPTELLMSWDLNSISKHTQISYGLYIP